VKSRTDTTFNSLVLALVLVATTSGCADWPLSSKWATDDPDYAEKYSEPYEDGEKPQRMLKQLVDARHLMGKSGSYSGAGGSGDPASAGAELGAFHYPTEWLEANVALSAIAGTGESSIFFGPEARLRIQSPTRFAPFVGVGGFTGGNTFDKPAENDGIDNNKDGFIDEHGEKKDGFEGFAAVYPEVGAHFWINGRLNLTASRADAHFYAPSVFTLCR